MKRRDWFLLTFLSVVVVACSMALVCLQEDRTNILSRTISKDTRTRVLSLSIIVTTTFQQDARSCLEQAMRLEIYNFIVGNPGTHFRCICDSLSLSIGGVQYHLRVLIKNGLVSANDDKRYKRYFQSKRFTKKELEILSLIRHDTIGKILALLSEKSAIFHKNLAFELGISSQALSYQTRYLRDLGLIATEKNGFWMRQMETSMSI